MAVIMQQKRATAARWAEVNPVLADGQIGVEKDTNRSKTGDGITEWSDLPYTDEGELFTDMDGGEGFDTTVLTTSFTTGALKEITADGGTGESEDTEIDSGTL